MPQTPAPRYALLVLAGFIVGVLVMVFAEKAIAPAHNEVEQPATVVSTSTPTTTDNANLQVLSQDAGESVRVSRVSLPEDGWLVVHEVEAGHVGNALGALRRDKGEYTDMAIELLRATLPGKEYAVILYADNANKIFEIKKDLPIINSDGAPVMVTFKTELE